MKYRQTAIILSLIFIFAGCGKDDEKKNNNSSFFPNNSTNVGRTNNSTNTTTSNNGTNNSTTFNNGNTANNGTNGTSIDILFVLDNSGSMCQEQNVFRKNFKGFADQMASKQKDFHIAVTTTHMINNYAPEPVARPGRIQSTPQPIPGFDRSCILSVDGDGVPIPGNYAPLRIALETALNCSDSPDPKLVALTDANIACAVEERNCAIPGICEMGRCRIKDIFPNPSSYRSIPKVLRAQDYQKNGQLEVEKLVADFTCMSFVGTRGHGIEKGLAAVVKATKPSLTGGSVESPTDAAAPNHGFLRKDSDFALAFLTDENDCSHNGTLDEASSCGDGVCEYANLAGDENASALTKIGDIKDQLITNLRASKGRTNFGSAQMRVASLHGDPVRFTGGQSNENVRWAKPESRRVVLPPMV